MIKTPDNPIDKHRPSYVTPTQKCKNHAAVDAFANCARCNDPLCGICAEYTARGVMCARCAEAVAAEKYVEDQVSRADRLQQQIAENERLRAEQAEERNAKTKAKDKKWAVMHGSIAAVGVAFIAARLFFTMGPPSMMSVAEVQAEIQLEDKRNNCVMVFWEIASILQNNRIPDESLHCADPAGTPNIVVQQGNDVIVRHPQPELLGYNQIYVSRSNPIPVLE